MQPPVPTGKKTGKTALATELFELTELAQRHGWSAEELLSDETKRREASVLADGKKT